VWQRDAFQGIQIARDLSGIARGRDKYLFEQVRVQYSVFASSRELASRDKRDKRDLIKE
jgi:hypothetical protein